jgi:hypothetical protein
MFVVASEDATFTDVVGGKHLIFNLVLQQSVEDKVAFIINPAKINK